MERPTQFGDDAVNTNRFENLQMMPAKLASIFKCISVSYAAYTERLTIRS